MRERSISFLLLAFVLCWPTIVTAQMATQATHPPFYLKTETGEIINPLTGQNAEEPYSPRLTCSSKDCHWNGKKDFKHEYETITKGYHFQQGADEWGRVKGDVKPWVHSPGMFGNF